MGYWCIQKSNKSKARVSGEVCKLTVMPAAQQQHLILKNIQPTLATISSNTRRKKALAARKKEHKYTQ